MIGPLKSDGKVHFMCCDELLMTSEIKSAVLLGINIDIL